jgi:hypothetical protein
MTGGRQPDDEFVDGDFVDANVVTEDEGSQPRAGSPKDKSTTNSDDEFQGSEETFQGFSDDGDDDKDGRYNFLSEAGKALYSLPHVRTLNFRCDSSGLPIMEPLEDVLRVEASLLQMRGIELPPLLACRGCQAREGPFSSCVIGSLPDGRKLYRGACANCSWVDGGISCSIGCAFTFSFLNAC